MFSTKSTRAFYSELNSLGLVDFLIWFKDQLDITWKPYTEEEISKIEQERGFRFPSDYRTLLTVLGIGKSPETTTVLFDWYDEENIAKRLEWPLVGLYFDIQYGLWGNNWGDAPNSLVERKQALTQLVANAPKLFPLMSHRYLVDYPVGSVYPVLSIYQSDIIVYGMNLQKYLLLDFDHALNLNHERAYANAVAGYQTDLIASIPFWGEIVLGKYNWDENFADSNS